ncbi:glycine-rich domain-containing protein, partial [Phenylobacterium sp.]|uniref:glycine-rich domain-containing protein n=1 Tax=Phenylobacterium sp. TaxID=1871053 RepID=UPI00345B8981
MGREVSLGGPLGGPLGGALGLRPATGGGAPAVPTIQLLLVGGGGAGREANLSSPGGGGAGGEVLEIEIPSPQVGSYPVTVGVGGIRDSSEGLGPAGRPTMFGGILGATGGGAGVPPWTAFRSIGANGGGDGFYPWAGFFHPRIATAINGNLGGSTFEDRK